MILYSHMMRGGEKFEKEEGLSRIKNTSVNRVSHGIPKLRDSVLENFKTFPSSGCMAGREKNEVKSQIQWLRNSPLHR
jgi:hypothetical protein